MTFSFSPTCTQLGSHHSVLTSSNGLNRLKNRLFLDIQGGEDREQTVAPRLRGQTENLGAAGQATGVCAQSQARWVLGMAPVITQPGLPLNVYLFSQMRPMDVNRLSSKDIASLAFLTGGDVMKAVMRRSLCCSQSGSQVAQEDSGLQGIFWTTREGISISLRASQSLQSCPSLSDPIDCSPLGFSVHGNLQARILVWVAMPLFRGSF